MLKAAVARAGQQLFILVAHVRVGGVSEEANNQAAAVLAGLELDDIILSQWASSAYRCASAP